MNTNVENVTPILRPEDGAPETMQENLQAPGLVRRVFRRIGRPRVMAEDDAKRQGVFLPNWWLSLLLIPTAGGVLWVATTLAEIKSNIAGLKDSNEFRLKQVETQGKLNDEHTRLLEIEIARTQGRLDEIKKESKGAN